MSKIGQVRPLASVKQQTACHRSLLVVRFFDIEATRAVDYAANAPRQGREPDPGGAIGYLMAAAWDKPWYMGLYRSAGNEAMNLPHSSLAWSLAPPSAQSTIDG